MSERSAGFTLVGVVVAIAVLTILIAAVAPSIATIVQRDKEIELIFRGKQYARSILAFQRRFGRYPNSLKELEEIKPRSIRQLWKEPMCNCDDGWEVIIAGTPGGDADGLGAASTGRLDAGDRPDFKVADARAFDGKPASVDLHRGGQGGPNAPGGGGPAPTPTPAPFSTGIFGDKPQTVGPIVGVRIAMHKKALRKWRDREYYDEWRFIAGDADNDVMDPANRLPPGMPKPQGPQPTPGR